MKNDLTIHMVLDRSGSMMSVRGDTVGAFNSYVVEVASKAPKSRLGLTTFADTPSLIFDNKEITKIDPLTEASYVPSGWTALYDAIGSAIDHLDKAAGKKVLVILTDGEENSSRHRTKDQIKVLLDQRQKDGWLVIYLGANQDAFAEGSKFGTRMGSTMNYATSNMAETMTATAASTLRYASGCLKDADFTDEERKQADG